MEKYYLKRRYVKGSLSNVDLNGDQKPDGFRFTFIAPPPALFGNLCFIHDLDLLVDDEKIDSSNILVHVKDKTYAVRDLIKSDDYCLEGDKVTIIVKKEGGLELQKEHSIKLSAIGNWFLLQANEFSLVWASDLIRRESKATA